MKRINNKKNLYKSIILLVLLVIGIGYAYLTSNLSISGQTEVVANTWNIHFENLNVKDGSVTASTPATIQSNNVDITYAITLSRPKEYYEFIVDVKNDGTLPGKVSISELSGLDTTSSKVIDYSIKYTNGNPVNIGDILNVGAKKSIKVRVYYKDDISASDLPSNNLNLTLTYTLQYIQSEEDAPPDATDQIIALAANNECMYQYTGAITDEVGNTENITSETSKVYFNRCADKRNIKFAGYCWQMIRTTETGGIKMIYNGEPDGSGGCGSSRGDHKGIVGATGSTENLNAENLYGDSFTYDITNSTFTLTDTTTATWSDSTYQNLLGKFTCRNTNGTCTTLYSVNVYYSNTTAYTSSYTIGDTNYAQIGTSSYNANDRSPAMVGYMFNKVYNYKTKSISGTNKFGSTFTYENGTYTISGTTQDLTTLSSANIDNTHYTCWNDTGTCNNIAYVYYKSSGSTGYYIEIREGKSINDALNEMFYNNDVNNYNSSLKGIVDSWYAQNLSSKTSMLEDTIFCNDRNMINQSTNGWNSDGGNTSTFMYIGNYILNNDMSCTNETDQFAVGNNIAKLSYPIGLATHKELYTLTANNTLYDSLTKTNTWWWGGSPSFFFTDSAGVRHISSVGHLEGTSGVEVNDTGGVRPVISLNSGATISSGTGSESDPFVIQE